MMVMHLCVLWLTRAMRYAHLKCTPHTKKALRDNAKASVSENVCTSQRPTANKKKKKTKITTTEDSCIGLVSTPLFVNYIISDLSHHLPLKCYI